MDEQMNQGSEPQQQSPMQPETTKNNSNALTIVVIIIILVIAAFLLWRYLPASDNATSEEAITDETVLSEEVPAPLDGTEVPVVEVEVGQ